MNAWKIVICIFSTVFTLAIVSLVFPKNGITIGNITLHFPTLEEALKPEASFGGEKRLTAEQRRELDALNIAKRKEFDEFCTNNPCRIYMPNNDTTYLDSFFEALDTASVVPTRVLHYGDSQLEGDRITSALREHFQKKFGGGGVGMVSAIPTYHPSYTLEDSVAPQLARYNYFGLGGDRHSYNNDCYGPMMSMHHLSGNCTMKYTSKGAKDFPTTQNFSRISIAIKGTGNFTAEVNGQTYPLKPKGIPTPDCSIYSATIKGKTNSVVVRCSGNADIYGVMMDGATGVSVDNIAMRGCSGNMFNHINKNSLIPFFKEENVSLVLLEYGTNSMPGLQTESQIQRYKNQIKETIAYFRSVAPKAKILFLGPPDMSTMIGGHRQTYPWLPNVVKVMREGVNEAGAAYWDMYSAMGGKNSMLEWVGSTPALAGRDYIHFTPSGSKKISQILYDTLLLYYKFYRFRTGKDPIELPSSETTETEKTSK